MRKMILEKIVASDGTFVKKRFPVLFVGLDWSSGSEVHDAVVMFDPEDEDAVSNYRISEKNPYVKVPLKDLRPTPEDFNKIFRI